MRGAGWEGVGVLAGEVGTQLDTRSAIPAIRQKTNISFCTIWLCMLFIVSSKFKTNHILFTNRHLLINWNPVNPTLHDVRHTLSSGRQTKPPGLRTPTSHQSGRFVTKHARMEGLHLRPARCAGDKKNRKDVRPSWEKRASSSKGSAVRFRQISA